MIDEYTSITRYHLCYRPWNYHFVFGYSCICFIFMLHIIGFCSIFLLIRFIRPVLWYWILITPYSEVIILSQYFSYQLNKIILTFHFDDSSRHLLITLIQFSQYLLLHLTGLSNLHKSFSNLPRLSLKLLLFLIHLLIKLNIFGTHFFIHCCYLT